MTHPPLSIEPMCGAALGVSQSFSSSLAFVSASASASDFLLDPDSFFIDYIVKKMVLLKGLI
jgi:hypothetical protein